MIPTALTSRERFLYSLLSLPTRSDLLHGARAVRDRALWPRQRLEEFRLRRCKEMLVHAGSHVPYYRTLFRERGFDPASFSTFDDLLHLPPLTRDVLTSRFSDLRSEIHSESDVTTVRTGGTTGTPVRVLHDRANAAERMLVVHRLFALMGRTLGLPTLLIAGNPIDAQAWGTVREKLKNRLLNVTVRSSFDLTPSRMRILADEIGAGKYGFVVGYASVFDMFATLLENEGRTIAFPRIVPTAELITPAQRERWTAALGAEIFELYGARELLAIAGETEDHCGLLVSSDLYHVEVTEETGTAVPHGNPGILTITNLIERGMPLIRYQLGDVGALCEGPPGDPHPFPRLRVTHGRVLDVIACPGGKVLPGEYFPHLMKEVAECVARFQVVQTELDRLTVRIVRKPLYQDTTTAYLRERIREQVGPTMEIEFDFVEKIETSASGKYRPTINLVPPDRRSHFWR